MDDCIFCQIIAGEAPASVVYEDELALAFLDIHAINPGDTLVAYTDGATEARDDTGRMLGIRGLQAFLAAEETPPLGAWADHVVDRLDRFRFGPPHDDTLVIEVYRPLMVDADRGSRGEASAAGVR